MANLTVSTTGTSAVDFDSVTLIGNITSLGTSGLNASVRGFQYALSNNADKEVSESGSFGTGSYSLNLADLTPGTTYHIRAFAIDSTGTYQYGTWITFITVSSQYSIVIGGIDRTADVLNQTPHIEDIINDKQNTLVLNLIDLSGNGIPETDDEIILTNIDGTLGFAGYIISVDLNKKAFGQVTANIQAVDYVRLLDRNLVHKTYESMTDLEIIEDIVATYCSGSGITTTNVVEGVTVDQLSFNYIQPSQALRKLCDLTGRNWFIDYEKDIHYFPLATNVAPFDIDISNNEYNNLKITKDASQIKNRVYVRGGTRLSDFTTYSEKGDGEKRQFVLPDKPHEVSIEVNGIAKTVGIKNVDTSGFDWYLNFQEKYLEQDSGGVTLTSADTIDVAYKYDIPILVAQENSASIMEHGVQEFAIFDKQITTTQAARDRALAELTDYANNVVEATFETWSTGFTSGQYMTVNLSAYSVNDSYIVQKVSARSMGGGKFMYTVSLASSKTMGIIRFLIELLENNRNIIDLDDNESVDELFTLTDQFLSDSLLDSLVIDSAGPYSTWCTDSLQITPVTRMRWDLSQWR